MRQDAAAKAPSLSIVREKYHWARGSLSPERMLSNSPIFRDRPELLDRVLRSVPFLGMGEAMIDMIVDKRALRAGDGVLDRLKLLREIDAGSLLLDHPDDAAQMAGRTVQPLDDGRVTGVSIVRHTAL